MIRPLLHCLLLIKVGLSFFVFHCNSIFIFYSVLHCITMVPNSYQNYQNNHGYWKLLMNFGLLKSPEHFFFLFLEMAILVMVSKVFFVTLCKISTCMLLCWKVPGIHCPSYRHSPIKLHEFRSMFKSVAMWFFSVVSENIRKRLSTTKLELNLRPSNH